MSDCKHQHIVRIPNFPGDCLVCRDCGAEACRAGYADGIRDYYVDGDKPWRRHREVMKLKWLHGGDELTQCTYCLFVGTIDDFDAMGADYGMLFCNQCGYEFMQEGDELFDDEPFVLEA